MIPAHSDKAWLYYTVLTIGYFLLCGAVTIAVLQSYALCSLYNREITQINSTSDRETLRLRYKERTRELYLRWSAVVVALMTCAFVCLLIIGIHLKAPELVLAYLVWATINATFGLLIICYNAVRCTLECIQYLIDWIVVCTLLIIILLVAVLYRDMQKAHTVLSATALLIEENPRSNIKDFFTFKKYSGLALSHLYFDTLAIGSTLYLFYGILKLHKPYILMWLLIVISSMTWAFTTSLVMYSLGEGNSAYVEMLVWVLRISVCFGINYMRKFYCRMQAPPEGEKELLDDSVITVADNFSEHRREIPLLMKDV